jgi:hypothetical protein
MSLKMLLVLGVFMVRESHSIGYRLSSPHGRSQQRHGSGTYPSAYYNAGREQFLQRPSETVDNMMI